MASDVARQRIASLEEDLQRIEAQLAGDPKIKVDDHPKVKQMLAARQEALLNLRRTTIEAPMDGVVSKVQVPGNYVVAGTPADVARSSSSRTAPYLARFINNSTRAGSN